MDILDRILYLMSLKKITQLELCNYIGINAGVFTNWKKRKTEPTTKYLVPIANYLGVSLDYLLTGKNPTLENQSLNLKLTPNEEECLNLFSQLNERNQIKFIARLEDALDNQNQNTYIKQSNKLMFEKPRLIASRTDNLVPSNPRNLTEEQWNELENGEDVDLN